MSYRWLTLDDCIEPHIEGFPFDLREENSLELQGELAYLRKSHELLRRIVSNSAPQIPAGTDTLSKAVAVQTFSEARVHLASTVFEVKE